MSRAAEFCKIAVDDDGRLSALLPGADWRLVPDLRPGCDVWISIYADDKRWCSRRVLQTVFGIVFDFWGCRRANALIDTDNKASLRLAEGVGFRYEGKMRQYRENGRDVYVLGMLKSECKFLKEKEK